MLTEEDPNSIAHGITVEKKRCTVRQLPPGPVQRDKPSLVMRPVMTRRVDRICSMVGALLP
jgi:hypothetical protein